jgi:50S ribosomal protein L16 3-hydroxylase
MSPARFLRGYWQKRPLLIRHAFADFRNPVAPNDFAGLACEELALARIVVHEPKRDHWILRNGPFAESDFAKLPKTCWTLLVQDVDKWDADVAALLAPFDFLPSWRIDDVMVSYAEDGGSVGAHVDQYDVFLLQGLGRRRWQISTDPAARKTFRDDAELKLLREFAPTHEWILEPGDMLYLPPGVPHHGVAIGVCMTYSIGMRAPSQAELLIDFAETLAETLPESLRLTDPDLAPTRGDGEIDEAAIARVLCAMPWLRSPVDASRGYPVSSSSRRKPGSSFWLQMEPRTTGNSVEPQKREQDDCDYPGQLDSSLLRTWFGRFITRYRSAQVAASGARLLTDAAFTRALAQGMHAQRNPWSRCAWMREVRDANLFVAGESHACSLRFARLVCTQANFPIASTPAVARDRVVLRALIGAGHLVLVRPPRPRRRP